MLEVISDNFLLYGLALLFERVTSAFIFLIVNCSIDK